MILIQYPCSFYLPKRSPKPGRILRDAGAARQRGMEAVTNYPELWRMVVREQLSQTADRAEEVQSNNTCVMTSVAFN